MQAAYLDFSFEVDDQTEDDYPLGEEKGWGAGSDFECQWGPLDFRELEFICRNRESADSVNQRKLVSNVLTLKRYDLGKGSRDIGSINLIMLGSWDSMLYILEYLLHLH